MIYLIRLFCNSLLISEWRRRSLQVISLTILCSIEIALIIRLDAMKHAGPPAHRMSLKLNSTVSICIGILIFNFRSYYCQTTRLTTGMCIHRCLLISGWNKCRYRNIVQAWTSTWLRHWFVLLITRNMLIGFAHLAKPQEWQQQGIFILLKLPVWTTCDKNIFRR